MKSASVETNTVHERETGAVIIHDNHGKPMMVVSQTDPDKGLSLDNVCIKRGLIYRPGSDEPVTDPATGKPLIVVSQRDEELKIDGKPENPIFADFCYVQNGILHSADNGYPVGDLDTGMPYYVVRR